MLYVSISRAYLHNTLGTNKHEPMGPVSSIHCALQCRSGSFDRHFRVDKCLKQATRVRIEMAGKIF